MDTVVTIDERPASSASSAENCSWRTRLMRFVDEPKSSTGAQIFAWMSVFFVIMSITGLMLGTVSHYRTHYPDWIIIIEACCVAWFSLELTLRTISERSIKRCLKNPLNIVDLVGIVPFCVDVVGWLYTGDKTLLLDNPENEVTGVKDQFKGAARILRLVRVLRVIRVLKVARYNRSLQVIGDALMHSRDEVLFLLVIIAVGSLFFSTLAYFFEEDVVNTKFTSIPASCWWCVITLTSVGYGDIYPMTHWGRVIAGIASVVGILVLATPISMVVEKFADAQERLEAQQEREDERTGASKLRKVFAGKFGAVRRLKQRRQEEEAKATNKPTSIV